MQIIDKYICMLIVFVCCKHVVSAQKQALPWNSLTSYIPVNIRYDTLEGVFLYENLIYAYIEGEDVIVKRGNFVKMDTDNKNLYQYGIFIYFESAFQYKKMKDENPYIHFDTVSVFKLFGEMRYKALQEGTFWEKTTINPFCGAYYKKYQMKVEVLYLGEVEQRLPLFMDCKEVIKYSCKLKGKNYQIRVIPTYLITKVFELKEL